MESNGNGHGDGDDPFVSCSSRDDEFNNEAVDDLLEECWFFNNLLKVRATMMLRCNSDPCPSSPNTLFIEKKEDDNGVVAHRGLIRAPSLPPCVGRKEEEQEREGIGTRNLMRQSSHQIRLQALKPSCSNKEKGGGSKGTESTSRTKFSGQLWRRKLQKAPSLPPNIGREDISCQENDSDARMSVLIQLAFATSTESLQPRHSSEDMIPCYSVPSARSPGSSEVESKNTNGIKEMNRRYHYHQKTIKKSLNDLGTEEVQGFKDLGFTFEKNDLSPNVASILPGLQDKKQEELSQKDNKMRRPYLSEAWVVQSCAPPAPPVPNCIPKNSTEDMKEQLKFWARAVAANVRQEC